MPKILIIGATGYLGKRVAEILVRSGQHEIYGIARTESKGRVLAAAEIRPVVCADPVNQPEAFLNAIRERHIDIVVDVAGAGVDSAKFLDAVRQIGEERLADYTRRGFATGPKLGYVYCSGTWVHGSSNTLVNDLDVPGLETSTAPPALVSWRVNLEQTILDARKVLDVAIVRPTLIYGYESTIWSSFVLPMLEAAKDGSSSASEPIQIPLEPDSRPGLIHVDDAAIGLKAVIEKLELINSGSVYPVFDLVTSQESMAEIFKAIASVLKFKGKYELIGASGNASAEAMSTSLRGSSARARQLLGWEATRTNGFVTDMDLYLAAFASQY